jgi:hypothetical protein
MKGDFSRIRFNPAKQYTAVLKQQGRVDLDSDANEQCFIDGHIDGITNTDVIGQYGGPAGCAGFEITISGSSILIGAGRYYVNGLLVENPASVNYDDQPYLISPTYCAEQLIAAANSSSNTVQFVLEVWQQLITGLDDCCLLEPALGQADTTVRLKTVWRVIGSVIPTSTIQKAEAINPANPVTLLMPCCQMLYAGTSTTPAPHTGLISADTNQTGSECGCQPIASAGYQGLENQLYRVEIHGSGQAGAATFKWSRENASVVTRITNISGAVLTVSSLGPDANLGFQNNQWVELTDDSYTYAQPANKPGQLLQIQTVNPATLQVTFAAPITGINKNLNPRMRRWDQSGTLATGTGVPTSPSPVQLENGIEVTFWGGQYTSGDYWTIPARTSKGRIEWPPCGSAGGYEQLPDYTRIFHAPLACMALRPSNSAVPAAGQADFGNYVVSDCRLLFSPLTALDVETGVQAIHVVGTSWNNDDVMTVDELVLNGLSVTFDQTTTCPWGGGNFQVSMEMPAVPNWVAPWEGVAAGLPGKGNYPPGTNVFGRSVSAIDPPLGIAVAGTQVTWSPVANLTGLAYYESYFLYTSLNGGLNSAAPLGFARVRVRLDSGAIYANGPSGNLYLDGTAFGQTTNRIADGSPCVMLSLPTGNNLKAADFDSWFYLAPSLIITGMTLQLLNSAGTVIGGTAVTIISDQSGNIGGIETTATPTTTSQTVSKINLAVTFSYTPVAPATLNFQLSYSGAANIATIGSPVNVTPGEATVNVPISVIGNPGVNVNANNTPNVDIVTITGSVSGALGPVQYAGTLPTLTVTGVASTTIIRILGGTVTTGLLNVNPPSNVVASVEQEAAAESAKQVEAAKQAEAKEKQNPEPPKE